MGLPQHITCLCYKDNEGALGTPLIDGSNPSTGVTVLFSLKSKTKTIQKGQTTSEIEVVINCTVTPSYPFDPPTITIESPPGVLKDYAPNTPVQLSLHWTPSLTLTSAVVDVGVRVREALLSGEPITHDVGMVDPSGPVPTSQTQTPVNVKGLKVGDSVLAPLIPPSYVRFPVECLKRPEFITSSVRRSSAGTSSMFSSMITAAKGVRKGVLSDSYLYVGGECILELSTPKFGTMSTVDVVLPVTTMSKLKFRRGESVSFTFKGAAKEPLIYMCRESESVVQKVKEVMGRKGVTGKHMKPNEVREVERAVELVTLIQIKEASMEESPPTLKLVEEIMDLYRRSIETFVSVGDERYRGVKEGMVTFLGRDDVVRVLDGGRIRAGKMETGTLSDDESDGEEEGDKVKNVLEAVEMAVKEADKGEGGGKKVEATTDQNEPDKKEHVNKPTNEVTTPKAVRKVKVNTPKGELLVRSPKFDVIFSGSGEGDSEDEDEKGGRKESIDFDDLMKSVDDIVSEIGGSAATQVNVPDRDATDVDSIEGELKQELEGIIKSLDGRMMKDDV